MKLAIIGGRDFNDTLLFLTTVQEFPNIEVVVSGGARGVDKLGELWANSQNIPTEIYYPDWDQYGKAAGFIRNKLIVENSDAVLAFWDGSSKGTKSSIDLAKKYNKKLTVVHY